MASFLSRLLPWHWRKKAGDDRRTLLAAGELSLDLLQDAERKLGTLEPQAQASIGKAYYDVGLRSLNTGSPGEAVIAFESAARLGCSDDHFHYNMALALSRSGQADAAHEAFLKAIARGRRDQAGDGYFIRNLYALDGVSLDDVKRYALEWAELYARTNTALRRQLKDFSPSPMRVGLLSGRFCRHAVGFLTLGGLEHVNPGSFEVIIYDNGSPKDDYTARFRALAHAVHDIGALTDDDAAELIRSHGLHLLVDMGGHSAGGRMGVMARKPAPIQVKWVGGQHGTTGLSQIDFFLTDSIETPDSHDPHFIEQPVRLPNSYAIYTAPPDAPDVNALPYASNGFVTFGCFNNIAKISTRTIEAWSHILTHVPQSRIMLKHLALAEEATRDRVAAQFSAFGIPPTRLELCLPSDQVDHLKAYHDVDLTLDPFPWSGCVTTCESLWMGVPVLAFPGVAFCHRHSASFLSTLELRDWIAQDVEGYGNKAISFANAPEMLAELRQTLRSRMKVSPLCDARRFAGDLEKVLSNMVHGTV